MVSLEWVWGRCVCVEKEREVNRWRKIGYPQRNHGYLTAGSDITRTFAARTRYYQVKNVGDRMEGT